MDRLCTRRERESERASEREREKKRERKYVGRIIIVFQKWNIII